MKGEQEAAAAESLPRGPHSARGQTDKPRSAVCALLCGGAELRRCTRNHGPNHRKQRTAALSADRTTPITSDT